MSTNVSSSSSIATAITTLTVTNSSSVQIGSTSSESTSAVSSVAQKAIETLQASCLICHGEMVAKNYEVNKEKYIFTLQCGHMFHRECISQWLQNGNTCPVCRGVDSLAVAYFRSNVTQEARNYPSPQRQQFAVDNSSLANDNGVEACGCFLEVVTETQEAYTCCWGVMGEYGPRKNPRAVVKLVDDGCGGCCVLRARGINDFVQNDCNGAFQIPQGNY